MIILKLQGLDPQAEYQEVEIGGTYGGDELMYYGISLNVETIDFTTVTLQFKKVENSVE